MSARIPEGRELQAEMRPLGVLGRIRLMRLARRGEPASTREEARLVVGIVRELRHLERLLLIAWGLSIVLGAVTTIGWLVIGETRWLPWSLAITVGSMIGLPLAIARRKRMARAERVNLDLVERRSDEP